MTATVLTGDDARATSLDLLKRVRELRDDRLRVAHRCVLAILVAFRYQEHTDDGHPTGRFLIRPSVGQVGDATSLGARHARRVIRELCELGYVEASKVERDGRGFSKRSYVLRLPSPTAPESRRTSKSARTASSRPRAPKDSTGLREPELRTSGAVRTDVQVREVRTSRAAFVESLGEQERDLGGDAADAASLPEEEIDRPREQVQRVPEPIVELSDEERFAADKRRADDIVKMLRSDLVNDEERREVLANPRIVGRLRTHHGEYVEELLRRLADETPTTIDGAGHTSSAGNEAAPHEASEIPAPVESTPRLKLVGGRR